MAGKIFHVVGVPGYHPHNTWDRRPDGLYELSGSVYAFNDDQVRECVTHSAHTWEECACFTAPDGSHDCGREGCTG